MNKKVIIFSTAYLPMIGGAEIAVKEITDRAGEDFNFVMITARIKKEFLKYEKIGNIEVYRIGMGRFFDKYLLAFLGPFKALKLIRACEEEKPIIWSIMASYGGFGALFLKILKPKWPFLLTLQEGDSEKHILKRVGIFYLAWKIIFKKADYIQVISNYLKDFALRYGARCLIEVVPNGVDSDFFKNRFSEEEKNNFRRELGLNEKNKVVITVSRLEKKNGVDILIKAIENLEAKLLIIGEGKEKNNLEGFVKKLGIGDKVKFLGRVDFKEVPKYLWVSDVFVRVSRSEGFGNVFIEAMASGVPVVATNIGGIKDFLKDRENGLVCEVDNSEDLVEKIKLVLENNNLREKIIEEGKETAKKYNWEDISLGIENIFNKIEKRENPFLQNKAEVKKKILIATPIYPPEPGGPAIYASGLREELIKKRIEVSVVSYGEAKNPEAKIVSRKIVKGLRHLIYLLKVLKETRGVNYIYALDGTATGLPAVISSLIWRKKFLIRIGGDLLWERASEDGSFRGTMEEFYKIGKYRIYKNWIYKVIRFVLKRADAVIVPANSLAEVYQKFYGVDEKKINVIRNVFVRSEEKKEKITEIPTVLFAGRLVKYKNLSTFIRVVENLELKFIIVGEGPEREALKLKVKNLKLEEKIEIRDKMERGELRKLIERSWVGVAVAWTEFNPNFILECLAQEKPVIISKNNSLSVELPNEFLIDPMNENDMREKLKKIIKNYSSYKRKIKKISLNYEWSQSVEEFLKLANKK